MEITVDDVKNLIGLKDNTQDERIQALINAFTQAAQDIIDPAYYDLAVVKLGLTYLIANEVRQEGGAIKTVRAGRMEIQYSGDTQNAYRDSGMRLLTPYLKKVRPATSVPGGAVPFTPNISDLAGRLLQEGDVAGWDR